MRKNKVEIIMNNGLSITVREFDEEIMLLANGNQVTKIEDIPRAIIMADDDAIIQLNLTKVEPGRPVIQYVLPRNQIQFAYLYTETEDIVDENNKTVS